MNQYVKFSNEFQKKLNDFPMFFAFSDKQFEEGMKKFGLDPDRDLDKIARIPGGGFIKKTDSKALKDLFNEKERRFQELFEGDESGEGFIKDMFEYELGNHEYGYTHDLSDTLDALGYTSEDIKNNEKLSRGLQLAVYEVLSWDD